MKSQLIILFSLLSILPGRTYAHRDFILERKFGNINVSISTGFKYEEISKVLIFGKLAEELARQFKVSNQIDFHFDQDYMGNQDSTMHICFYKLINRSDSMVRTYLDFPTDSSIFSFNNYSRNFDILTNLKILDFILKIKKARPKDFQRHLATKHYDNFPWPSMDTSIIESIKHLPPSRRILKLLRKRIKRPDIDTSIHLTYYFKNNRFNFYFKNNSAKIPFRFTSNDINLLIKLPSSNYLLFDTDSSFFFVNYSKGTISNRQVIPNMHPYIRPSGIQQIDDDQISIQVYSKARNDKRVPIHRTVYYSIKSDFLEDHPKDKQ